MVGSGNTTPELRTVVLFGGKDRYHFNVQTSLSAYCIPDTRINIRVTVLMNLGSRCNLVRRNTSSLSYLRFKIDLIECKQRWLSSADYLLWIADSSLDTACLCAQLLCCAQLFMTPWTVDRQAPLPWDSPGKNAGGGCHFLPQGIFPTRGSNLQLLHWLVNSLLLIYLRSPPGH